MFRLAQRTAVSSACTRTVRLLCLPYTHTTKLSQARVVYNKISITCAMPFILLLFSYTHTRTHTHTHTHTYIHTYTHTHTHTHTHFQADISLSCQVPGLLVTCSSDDTIKFWDIQVITFIHDMYTWTEYSVSICRTILRYFFTPRTCTW